MEIATSAIEIEPDLEQGKADKYLPRESNQTGGNYSKSWYFLDTTGLIIPMSGDEIIKKEKHETDKAIYRETEREGKKALKLSALSAIFGILNDLTQTEMEKFEEAIKRIPLFQ